MIKVLQYIPAFNFGGIESFILDVNRLMKDEFLFVYLVENDLDEEWQNRIKSYGAEIVRIPNLTKEGIWKHIFSIKKVIKKGDYDIIHVHGCNIRIFAMFFAKIYKIKRRIYHVHSSRIEGNQLLNKIGMKINMMFSNCWVACSNLSAKKMYKKRSSKVQVIESNIDLSKYLYSEEDRNKIRQKYKVKKEETLIGTIGRLAEVKNQEFLLEILQEYLKRTRNVKLMIVGDGPLKIDLIKKSKEMGIENNVIFSGKQKETKEFYSAMDIFCLPSLSEGYPVTLIEAQANGIKCTVSSVITKEVNATGEIQYLDIGKENIKKWIESIEYNKNKRYNKIEELKKAGFDIRTSVEKLYSIYVRNG